MNTDIKLYATSINNFRINRVIRTKQAAERAVNDLREKLANEEITHLTGKTRRAYGNVRLKISLRTGNSPFLASKVYWLGNETDWTEAVEELQSELKRVMSLHELHETAAKAESIETRKEQIAMLESLLGVKIIVRETC